MFERLETLAISKPATVSIVGKGFSLTAGELYDTSLRFAKWLKSNGVKEGDVVGLDLQTEIQIVFVFSCYLLGATSCQAPQDQDLLESIDCGFRVSQSSTVGPPSITQLLLGAEVMKEIANYQKDQLLGLPRVPAGGNLFFSSGTTGRPKAVLVSHPDLITREAFVRKARIRGQYMTMLGLGSFGGFMTAISQITAGETYFSTRRSEDCLSVISNWGVETLFASPSQLESLLDEAKTRDVNLKLVEVQSTGTGISKVLADRVQAETSASLISVYASTEGGLVAIKSHSWENGSYTGEVLPDVELEVVDVEDAGVPDGTEGKIRLRGPGQAIEYLQAKEQTALAFRDGWFYPGDIGFLEGSSLFLSGRDSEMLNAGGFKVDPYVLDEFAKNHVSIDDAAVFIVYSASEVKTIGLAFVSKTQLNPNALKAYIGSKYGDAAPTNFYRLSSIPRGDSGKPLRQAISDLFRESKENLKT